MRSIPRRALVLLAALLALTAVASASASAATPAWWIGGSQLKGEETIKAVSGGPVSLEGDFAAEHSKISCEGLGVTGTSKIASGGAGTLGISLTGCQMTGEATGCVVPSSLSSSSHSSSLVGEGEAVYEKAGASGEGFMSFAVTGCALERSDTISGAARCELVAPQIESAVKECSFTTTSGSTLTSMSRPVTLLGNVYLELSGTGKARRWTGSASPRLPELNVNGKLFGGSESVQTTVSEPLLVKSTVGVTNQAVEISCASGAGVGSIAADSEGSYGSGVTLGECKVLAPSGCTTSASLKFNSLTSEMEVGERSKAYLRYEHEAGGSLASVTLSGCAAEGTYKLTGSIRCEVKNPESEAITKECAVTSTSGSELKFGGKTATLGGTLASSLNGGNAGKPWSIT